VAAKNALATAASIAIGRTSAGRANRMPRG
jgi:hypothetical protein